MSDLMSRPTRLAAWIFGAIAAATMFYLYNPWLTPKDTVLNLTTWAFWISAIALLVALFLDRASDPKSGEVEIEGPSFARFLFNNSRAGLFWLPIRIFVGFEWFEAGWHKFTGTGWLDGGAALTGYWTNAVKIPDQGSPSITFEWYRSFLQFLLDNHAGGWFAWLITFGELAVGLGILFGALTGIAAFFGALMNMSFLLAGSASVNPVLFTFAIGLMMAWKVAGYYGLDRYLLPALGAPWRPGTLFLHGHRTASAGSGA